VSRLLPQPLLFYQDANGRPLPGAKCYTYLSATDTPTVTYQDSALTIPHANPQVALNDGYFRPVYSQAGLELKIVLTDAAGGNPRTIDPASPFVLTSEEVGDLIYPTTDAETNSGVVPTDQLKSTAPYDVTRVGIAAGSLGAATDNTAAAIQLFDPTKNGIKGDVFFPNNSGTDTYYFNDMIQLRDGLRLNLNWSTLDFTKTYAAADDLMGFLNAIRDVVIENGNINIHFDGSAGVNAGPAIRLGSRLGYKFGAYPGGVEEEDLTVPMGNIVLRNLRITSNNPIPVIFMFGGLRNVRFENVTINGMAMAPHGVYYEFGDWHYEAAVLNRKTTHASGIHFINCSVTNLDPAALDGGGFAFVGAGQVLLENCDTDAGLNGFQFRPGEALYFNPGPPDVGMTKRCMTLINCRAKNGTNVALQLTGAESKAGGYLAGEPSVGETQQTDLMRFVIIGGIFSAAGKGCDVSGPVEMHSVTFNGAASSGQLVVSDECIRGTFTNCEFRNSTGIGVRANVGDHLWATTRLKTLIFDNCQCAGNAGNGYSFGHTKSVEIRGGRIGYQLALDGVAESSQTIGVNVDQTSLGGGVYCYGVDAATSGGVAYSIVGTITNPCGLYHPKGTVTTTGAWDIDGVARTDDSNFTSKTSFLNTAGKYAGRKAFNTTDNKEYFARGATDVSVWGVADASATITPA